MPGGDGGPDLSAQVGALLSGQDTDSAQAKGEKGPAQMAAIQATILAAVIDASEKNGAVMGALFGKLEEAAGNLQQIPGWKAFFSADMSITGLNILSDLRGLDGPIKAAFEGGHSDDGAPFDFQNAYDGALDSINHGIGEGGDVELFGSSLLEANHMIRDDPAMSSSINDVQDMVSAIRGLDGADPASSVSEKSIGHLSPDNSPNMNANMNMGMNQPMAAGAA